MSFNWKDYVSLAEDLVDSAQESTLRSCVSRAYYGVFCIARDGKSYKSYKPKPGENLHRKIIDEYKNSSDVKEQQTGLTLDNLRKSRNYADYDADKQINGRIAQRAVNRAKQILENLGMI